MYKPLIDTLYGKNMWTSPLREAGDVSAWFTCFVCPELFCLQTDPRDEGRRSADI